MTSTSAFFRKYHQFLGIGGHTKTVFCLTLYPRIKWGAYQTCNNNARNFDMSIVVTRGDYARKFRLFATFHGTFFNRCLLVMVLALNNKLTGSRRLVYTYKKYKKHYHAWSWHIFYPIRSQNEIFFPENPNFCQVENWIFVFWTILLCLP